jgi:hypothetical protein
MEIQANLSSNLYLPHHILVPCLPLWELTLKSILKLNLSCNLTKKNILQTIQEQAHTLFQTADVINLCASPFGAYRKFVINNFEIYKLENVHHYNTTGSSVLL